MKNRYAHQAEIVKEDPEKTGLFLGTGSGKTRIALDLAKGPTMVIAPKTQVEDGNWEREAKAIGFRFPLRVISKEMFRRDHATLPGVDTLIGDEAHTLLGVTANVRWRKKKPVPKTSQLFEALEAYVERTKPKRIYLCTATIMRSPMTVWAAAKILGRKIDWRKFRDEYYVRLPMPFREVYAPRSDDGVKNSLAKLVKKIGYVGRLEDFFDVPEQTWKTDMIDLTAEQKKRLAELPVEFPDPLVCVGKKHQVENGVLSGDEYNAPEFFDSGKIDRILDYAVEFPRIVVFANYRAQIDQIEAGLRKAGKHVITLTGDTKQRGEAFKKAVAASECIFVAQAQISAGWELKEYPCMIFASRTYNWVDFDQAIGRIQRADHIKKNLYVKLITRPAYEGTGKNRVMLGGVDQAIDRALENKQDFNDRLYAEKS